MRVPGEWSAMGLAARGRAGTCRRHPHHNGLGKALVTGAVRRAGIAAIGLRVSGTLMVPSPMAGVCRGDVLGPGHDRHRGRAREKSRRQTSGEDPEYRDSPLARHQSPNFFR